VIHADMAPSILDVCGAPAMKDIQGKSWKNVVQGDTTDWRKAWLYEYNYEKQFPYTPNVRALRTAGWKYVRYPNAATPHKPATRSSVPDPKNAAVRSSMFAKPATTRARAAAAHAKAATTG